MFEVGTAVDVDGRVEFVREEPCKDIQITMVPATGNKVGVSLLLIRKDGSRVSPYPPNNIIHECTGALKIKAAYNKLLTPTDIGVMSYSRYVEVLRKIRQRYEYPDPKFPTLQHLAIEAGGAETATEAARLELLHKKRRQPFTDTVTSNKRQKRNV